MLSLILLAVAGILAVVGILLGVDKSVVGLMVCLSAAVMCAALAKVLDNQEKLLKNQEHMRDALRQLTDKDTRVCAFCGKSYGSKQSSCPHCGRRADEGAEA